MAGEFYLVNPPKKRRHRRRKKSVGRKRHRRRYARRNDPGPVRRHRRRRYYAKRKRRGMRHNPGKAFEVLGLDVGAALLGASGAVVSELGTGFISNMVPAQLQSGAGRLALKTGVVLALPFAAKPLLGRRVANLLTIGAGIGLALDAYKTFIQPMIPGLPQMADYEISGYTSADPTQLGAGAEGDGDIEALAGLGAETYFD